MSGGEGFYHRRPRREPRTGEFWLSLVGILALFILFIALPIGLMLNTRLDHDHDSNLKVKNAQVCSDSGDVLGCQKQQATIDACDSKQGMLSGSDLKNFNYEECLSGAPPG